MLLYGIHLLENFKNRGDLCHYSFQGGILRLYIKGDDEYFSQKRDRRQMWLI